ncbi:MAG: AAA family ATPase [Gammaproteobacteria bacterium 28-57-27]|nr:MAG: AAA family ATPase [Gammaproteobacteria bacterium 28-57-27]
MNDMTPLNALRSYLESVIVGQHELLDRLLISLLTGGHLLVEGLPGLAKTTAIKTLSEGVHASFQRIQFTPDLLPSDLTGAEIYDPETHQFNFRAGPLFHEIVLADEINRAPAKVQAALLEAMQEHQVTIGGVSHPLPELFMVMATQNPLDQAGTYPLPEAQLDRFLLHVVLDYPTETEELEVLRRHRAGTSARTQPPQIDVAWVLDARRRVLAVHIAPELEAWIVHLVAATRDMAAHVPAAAGQIECGASPRASLALAHATQALAFLRGRDFVTPEDLLDIAPDALRHRLLLSPVGQLARVNRDALIAKLCDALPIV